jgi:uncharacterized protein (TIGR03546 family)
MTVILKQVFKLVYLLHSETSTRSISIGLSCGIVLGFSPMFSLQSLLILGLILFFRIQVGAAFLSAVFFKLVAIPLVPLFDVTGNWILSLPVFQPVFTWLYNLPIVPMTRFYNTVVMGGGIVAIVLTVPAYFLFEYLVDAYRAEVVARIKETKLWTVWKTSKLFKWYQYYRSARGIFS